MMRWWDEMMFWTISEKANNGIVCIKNNNKKRESGLNGLHLELKGHTRGGKCEVGRSPEKYYGWSLSPRQEIHTKKRVILPDSSRKYVRTYHRFFTAIHRGEFWVLKSFYNKNEGPGQNKNRYVRSWS
jgi:hypothetical protein